MCCLEQRLGVGRRRGIPLYPRMSSEGNSWKAPAGLRADMTQLCSPLSDSPSPAPPPPTHLILSCGQGGRVPQPQGRVRVLLREHLLQCRHGGGGNRGRAHSSGGGGSGGGCRAAHRQGLACGMNGVGAEGGEMVVPVLNGVIIMEYVRPPQSRF